MPDALCIGFACFDFTYYLDGFPEEDGKIFVSETEESGGGPAANAACLLAAWGVPTAFAGCVGDDREGAFVMEEFRKAGVDAGFVRKAPGRRTPFATILVNRKRGTRTVLTRRDDPPEYRPDWTRLSSPPRFILADGHRHAAARDAIDRFPDATVILDAGSLREGTRALLPLSAFALCSEAFGAAFIGRSRLETIGRPEEAALAVQAACPGRAAITLGERGLVFVEDGRARRLEAFPVKAVDTTAAGDVFHGAFASALLERKDFRDALVFAQAAAALSVTRPGGRRSFPARAEVVEFLAGERGKHM